MEQAIDEADLMNLLELPDTLADKIGCLIRPIVQPPCGDNGSGEVASPALFNRWQVVLQQLADWKNNPDELADEGVIAPSAELLATADEIARLLCARGVEPPDRLLTNGDGGVVFRWRLPDRTWTIELDVDGSIESSLMAAGRLLWRHSIHEQSAATP